MALWRYEWVGGDERDERDNNEVGYHFSLRSCSLCVSVVSVVSFLPKNPTRKLHVSDNALTAPTLLLPSLHFSRLRLRTTL